MGAGTTKKKACGHNSQKEDQSPSLSPSTTKQKKILNINWTANGSHLILILRYHSLATKVTLTGGGVSNVPIGEDEFADSPEDFNSINPKDSSTTAWIMSIPHDGPEHGTPEHVRNVWVLELAPGALTCGMLCYIMT
ncbi:hypothetical protein V8D89_006620 [Ganoderma adspersum]